MKLLAQTNRIYLGFSLVVYLLTALAFYQISRLLIYDEVESRLRVEKRDFEAYARAHNTWASSPYFVENKIEITPVRGPGQPGEAFVDTLIYNHYDNEMTPFRQLTFFTPIRGQLYRVEIRKSLIQTYRLIEVITVTMVLFLGLLLLGMFWFQSRLSGQLWLPFYDTLSRIKEFDLRQGTPIRLQPSSITEFSELNDVLAKMADKMQHDYQGLKEFTENASHEMQTPLALINAKVEQLIQSSQLTEHQSDWIDGIYQASRRMARLNQGLLLLAKIENGQFGDTHTVDLTAELMQRLTDMDEVITHKQLTVSSTIGEAFLVQLPTFLADSLVTNLISNAIRHNLPGGTIHVYSSAEALRLSNTGPAPVADPATLFDRFKKGAANAESVGLGLAIVRQICHSYQLGINYQYQPGIHTLALVKQVTDSEYVNGLGSAAV